MANINTDDRLVSAWIDEYNFRKENAHWLQYTNRIAAKICIALRKNKMTKQQLANKLCIELDTMNRIVKGRENMTVQTICEIEQILGVKLINVATNN